MAKPGKKEKPILDVLSKCPTGITGLDEITGGGLPQGRPTLVCGGTGCGKTLLAMEFLVRGATQFNEPGVYMSFEEKSEELVKNFASLGFDLNTMVERKKLSLDYVHIERSEIEETGEYDLEGLFIRLGHAIDTIGAKRVVLDTVETLFSGFTNEVILRAELKRLFAFLKTRGVTAVITGEQGERNLTRFGLEEYVADCVIFLSHKVSEQIATRRMRIVKYRGSAHGTNEYPFMIDEQGFSVMPISSLGLDHPASSERISSGVPRLDTMLGGKGYFRGSSILVTGTAGAGKSSMAAHFVDAACRRGERCLYFAFEESRNQIIRNMRSIGIDLEPWVNKGLLEFRNSRPTLYGLEMHLVTMHKAIEALKPIRCRGRSHLQPGGRGKRNGGQVDALPADRLPEDAADNRLLHRSDHRRREPGADRGGDILSCGHLAPAAGHGVERRTQPRPVHPQVPRHGALQSGPGILPEQ